MDQKIVDKHVEEYSKIKDVDDKSCSNFLAYDKSRREKGGFKVIILAMAENGVAGLLCSHRIPLYYMNMMKGEKYCCFILD